MRRARRLLRYRNERAFERRIRAHIGTPAVAEPHARVAVRARFAQQHRDARLHVSWAALANIHSLRRSMGQGGRFKAGSVESAL